ncbi:hypothetical protein M2169_005245 [Streptomyces sp. MJP52]|nr:hypothetical protein [Streptomyces sp. MJP52]
MGDTGVSGSVPALPPLDIEKLPLVLAGPMVRRVDETGVTVFFALKAARRVTVEAYAGSGGPLPPEPAARGTAVTARIGEHLHVVAVTARPVSGGTLPPGTVHRYTARFSADTTAPDAPVPAGAPGLFDDGVVHAQGAEARRRLLYTGAGAPDLPSFVTPPDHPSKLRFFHASCRKPHGEGLDALAVLDQVLKADIGKPAHRPQQLFLTGDQIYADDVAEVLLHMCTQYGRALLGRDETFPTVPREHRLLWMKPGKRQQLTVEDFHLTSGEGQSHLLTLAEFCVMYLMVWSDVLWPDGFDLRLLFPEFYDHEDLVLDHPHPDQADELWFVHSFRRKALDTYRAFLGRCGHLKDFRRTLPRVRRALANTATYMMFDDHEVTDDWYIASSWVDGVCSTDHGRRFLANGIAAYAVFQHWGNVPAAFGPGPEGEAGRDLLAALAQPDHTAPGPAAVIARRTGVPSGTHSGRITRADGSLPWHYSVDWPAHQLVAVDTRTQRVFRGGPKDSPALIWSDPTYEAMLASAPDRGPEKVTVLLSPCPVLGHPLIEEIAQPAVKRITASGYLSQDVEAWSHDEAAFHKFLARLLGQARPGPDGVRRRRVISLGGDVHYAFAVRMRYAATQAYKAPEGKVRGVLAQLTASSLKNEAGGTKFLQNLGYAFTSPWATHLGWNVPHGQKVTVDVEGPPGSPDPVRTVLTESPGIVRPPRGGRLLGPAPHWECLYEYFGHRDPMAAPRPGATIPVAFPPDDPRQAVADYAAASGNHHAYLVQGTGRAIVGRNNIGDITFTWGADDDKSVIQTLWWRFDGQTTAAPLTRFVLPLPVGPDTGTLAPDTGTLAPDTSGAAREGAPPAGRENLPATEGTPR